MSLVLTRGESLITNLCWTSLISVGKFSGGSRLSWSIQAIFFLNDNLTDRQKGYSPLGILWGKKKREEKRNFVGDTDDGTRASGQFQRTGRKINENGSLIHCL